LARGFSSGEIVQQPFGLDRAEIPQPLFAEVRLEPFGRYLSPL